MFALLGEGPQIACEPTQTTIQRIRPAIHTKQLVAWSWQPDNLNPLVMEVHRERLSSILIAKGAITHRDKHN
jgi:hypothetical protein